MLLGPPKVRLSNFEVIHFYLVIYLTDTNLCKESSLNHKNGSYFERAWAIVVSKRNSTYKFSTVCVAFKRRSNAGKVYFEASGNAKLLPWNGIASFFKASVCPRFNFCKIGPEQHCKNGWFPQHHTKFVYPTSF